MIYDISKYENLPFRGKISVTSALMALKPKGNHSYTDWDCSNQAHGHWHKKKAKNAKAKHRKKFNR